MTTLVQHIWCFHKRHIGVLGIMLVVCALLTFGVWTGGQAAGRDAARSSARSAAIAANTAVLRSDAATCERNQIQRVYDRVDEAAQRQIVSALDSEGKDVSQAPLIARVYLKIVNCGATYSPDNVSGGGGDPVYLQAADERCFMRLVVTHYFASRSPTTNPHLLRRIC